MVPHTVVVDFAVALLATSVVCDLLSSTVDEQDLRIVASWTLTFGALAAAFAVLSGYAAYNAALPTGAAEVTVLRHRLGGWVVLATFAPLAAWRLVARGKLPERGRSLYWVVALLGAGALATTAYLGGNAVYQHGVGVTLVP
ncbi:MAG TPA: DUF2231 domain-containing protein [Acidobacteriota bacterium]|nr:DUF2231 domain-containing protein [Acidobacteriota bacterium]